MVKVFINDVAPKRPTGTGRMGAEQALSIFNTAEGFSHMKYTDFIEPVEAICNPLIKVAYNSFAKHIPMVLTPDIIWHTIMNGVTMHVNKNPGSETGKREISVHDDSSWDHQWDGSWDNQWVRSIQIIKEQLLQHKHAIIKTEFTTTGPAESVAHAAALMDVVNEYCKYKYTAYSMCGIPWVDVTGTVEDWEKMGQVLDPVLQKLDLNQWNQELQEIIRHFADAVRGQADKEHWNSIFNYNGPAGSGSVSGVSGWLGKLFLYTRDGINPLLEDRPADAQPISVPLEDFPPGLTVTPFNWTVRGTMKEMSLVSGLVGVSISYHGGGEQALKPVVGWIIGSGSCSSDKLFKPEASRLYRHSKLEPYYMPNSAVEVGAKANEKKPLIRRIINWFV